MRILTVSPAVPPSVCGNAVDLHRINSGLSNLADDIVAMTPAEVNFDIVARFAPDVIHAYNAYKSNRVAAIAKKLNIPLVVTMSGTDYNTYLDTPETAETVVNTIENSAALVVFNQTALQNFKQKLPVNNGKTIVIRRDQMKAQSNAKVNDTAIRRALGIGLDQVLFSLPSGIRPVKNNLFLLKPFERLHKAYPNTKLLFLGPALDQTYFKQFQKELSNYPFAIYGGQLLYAQMPALYQESNVVLNCSHSEGVSNVLCEAMQHGCAILASDISGNTAVIKQEQNGLLYPAGSEDGFYRQAARLIQSQTLCNRLGKQAKQHRNKFINPNEAQDYFNLFLSVTQKRNRLAG